MKISYNWLKEYIKLDMPIEQLSDILTEIGLEVEGVETVESVKGSLNGLVVGHVTHREKHPNADKLSLTKVDVGTGEELQIVCGAPNVDKGQKVIVAQVGVTVYPTNGEPFKIKKAKIRGIESRGMICSEDEIGLGHNHNGIMVLPEEIPVGYLAKDCFDIEIDTIFEIGLTPNRSDATSHIGVAEDLAAALKINYGHDGKVNWPSIDKFKVSSKDLTVKVEVEEEVLCPRYSGVSIKGIKVGESPKWLVNRLKSIGIRSTNNVVDITNFVLHELGQPLHAFDLDEVKGRTIKVKTLPEGTKFITLDEVERSLSAEDLMICDGDSKGMCIAGVFGGVKSGVTETTTDIFLESAHFNAKSNRRSSTRHLLRTDAAKIFEKGSDPNRTIKALKRAALLIQEVAGGKIASKVVDFYPKTIEPKIIEVRVANVNRLIGKEMSAAEIKNILLALNMEIKEELTFFDFRREDNDVVDGFIIAVPTNKADVVREVDVIEEILRIYGFNKVEIKDKVVSSLAYSPKPNPHKITNVIGNFLAAVGFNEMMAMSITQSKYYEKVLTVAQEERVFINNTSNQHLDLMRPEMLISALEAVRHNQNRQSPDLKFFEFGKSYRKGKNGYAEQKHLSLVMTGRRKEENWLEKGEEQISFYSMKSVVDNVLFRLGIKGFKTDSVDNEKIALGLVYARGRDKIVEYGKVRKKVLKAMDIKQDVYYADFNWDVVLKALKNQKIIFEEMPKFPSVRRDLALIIDKKVAFSQIEGLAKKQGKKILESINLFDVYEHEEKIGKGKRSYSVSFIFRDPKRTLKDKDVDAVMKKIMSGCESKLQAVIRR